MGAISTLSEDTTVIKEFEGQKDFRIVLYISKCMLMLHVVKINITVFAPY